MTLVLAVAVTLRNHRYFHIIFQLLQISWKYYVSYFKFMVVMRAQTIFFSSVVYYRILNIVPCAVEDIVVYLLCI